MAELIAAVVASVLYVKVFQRSDFLTVPPRWQDRHRRAWWELAIFDFCAVCAISASLYVVSRGNP